MYLYISESNDPYFNIASEEFFVKNFREDIFLFYVNDPSIIIGKHQNAYGEINFPFIKENNIPVVRRISGGGTVYHDRGNLNFSCITNEKEGFLVDYSRVSKPVMNGLTDLNLSVNQDDRNNFRIDGLKISGNASHVYKKRVLHHGTLLFKSELDTLNDSIHPSKSFKDKSVQSIRSVVVNISDFLDKSIDFNTFLNSMANSIKNFYDADIFQLTQELKTEIEKLKSEKYLSWEWNFGYSPKYSFETFIEENGQKNHFLVFVEKGIIRSIVQVDDKYSIPEKVKKLVGLPHKLEILEKNAGKQIAGLFF